MRLLLAKLFQPKPAPVGRRGVFECSAHFGRSLLFGSSAIDAKIQVEVVELERNGSLSKVWYDKRTMTGLPPTAYPSTICSLLPAWQRTENIVWLEDSRADETDETDEPAAKVEPRQRSRVSPLAGS